MNEGQYLTAQDLNGAIKLYLMFKKISNLEGVVVLNNDDKKKIRGKGPGDEFLDCAPIEYPHNGEVHLLCCSKPVNGQGGGTCFWAD